MGFVVLYFFRFLWIVFKTEVTPGHLIKRPKPFRYQIRILKSFLGYNIFDFGSDFAEIFANNFRLRIVWHNVESTKKLRLEFQ
jgi:hypothetical protein